MPRAAAAPHAIFAQHGAPQLAERLRGIGVSRPLIVTTPARRHLEELGAALSGFEVAIFDQAVVHVPANTVADALRVLDRHSADAVVTLGGGSATGLGKAIRLERDLRFAAIPTTFSGSEMTRIWGTTRDDRKQTGRDDRVLPDVVLYDAALLESLPRRTAAASLVNALAHPISALASSPDDPSAAGPIGKLFAALEAYVAGRTTQQSTLSTLRAVVEAARILDSGTMASQHRVAHALGGRFKLEHSSVHAALLPSFTASLREGAARAFSAIADATHHDPAAAIHDALRSAGAATSLLALDLKWADVIETLAEHQLEDPAVLRWVRDAYLGRRPSVRTRRDAMGDPDADLPSVRGPALADASRVVIALHGRREAADDAIALASQIVGDDPKVAIVAPQAADGLWYGETYRELEPADPGLLDSIERIAAIVSRVAEESRDKPLLMGFSQGAVLALEVAARHAGRLGCVVALCGPRIGVGEYTTADASGLPVLIGASDCDELYRFEDVERSAKSLADAGASVELIREHSERHQVTARQRIRARELLTSGGSELQWGFGNAHQSEALPGALPLEHNSPREAPYGLYSEQVNGTGFVADRAHNLRTWCYRIRPAASQGELDPLEHGTFTSDFVDGTPEINLSAHLGLPEPSEPTDFIDGLHTYGGAGSPALRRGFAIHFYAANRSMDSRSFYNADGDLLLVPEYGALVLQTELGVLHVAPGEIAIVPRGVRFSVLLTTDWARGYVGEIYGRHFELPERGPVGANGLADARHFRAPTAWPEDRAVRGYRVVAKLGGRLFTAPTTHSPYDVVAWHGNYTPHAYALSMFSPVANVRVDHGDPSIYTVLSAPLDELGAHCLDFVAFPPRWDATEGTFRPPFFHRNAVTEINGIVSLRSPPARPFRSGMVYLTPSMTPHGVRAASAEAGLRGSDEPRRHNDPSVWFQFETVLPLSLSRWAIDAPTRIEDWPRVWGHYRTHYQP